MPNLTCYVSRSTDRNMITASKAGSRRADPTEVWAVNYSISIEAATLTSAAGQPALLTFQIATNHGICLVTSARSDVTSEATAYCAGVARAYFF